jgi:hypothetical protein
VLRRIATAVTQAVIGLSASLSVATGARAFPPLAREAPSLRFERNDGQFAAPVKFVARGRGSTLFLTPGPAVLATTVTGRAGSPPGEVVLE